MCAHCEGFLAVAAEDLQTFEDLLPFPSPVNDILEERNPSDLDAAGTSLPVVAAEHVHRSGGLVDLLPVVESFEEEDRTFASMRPFQLPSLLVVEQGSSPFVVDARSYQDKAFPLRLQQLPLLEEEGEVVQKRFLVMDASTFAGDDGEGVKVEEREKRKDRDQTWRLRFDKQLQRIVRLREKGESTEEGTSIGKAFR